VAVGLPKIEEDSLACKESGLKRSYACQGKQVCSPKKMIDNKEIARFF
jgi:hypothetical protein